MEKQTKIIIDKRQTRATIPQEFVNEFDVASGDKIKWCNRRNALIGRLIKTRVIKNE